MILTNAQLKQLIQEELRAVLGEAGNDKQREEFVKNGKIRLFHFPNTYAIKDRSDRTGHKEKFEVDPAKFTEEKTRSSYSQREYDVSSYPRSFYYADPNDRESMFDKNQLYFVDVDASSVYDFKNDPENFKDKHRNEHGVLQKWWGWNPMLEDIHSKYKGVYYTLGGPGGPPTIAYFDKLAATRVDFLRWQGGRDENNRWVNKLVGNPWEGIGQ